MIPGGDIVIGIFVHVLIALTWGAVKLAVRAVRCCVIDHPFLTALLFAASWRQGWIASQFPELMVLVAWFPLILLGLVGLAAVRWATPDHLAETRRFYRREVRRRERWARDQINDRREQRAERERVRNLPPPPVPPPVPIPMGPVTTEVPA